MSEIHFNRRKFLKTGIVGSSGMAVLPVVLSERMNITSDSMHQSQNAVSPTPLELRYRQIHLDFHTSEKITGIGNKFDPEEFAFTLANAHVNSVTCFGRCHHGWIYHDTQKFPERKHPHLSRNLLKEQIEACHKRNIRVPIYITVQWDHFTAREHPEWIQVSAEGSWVGTPPYEAGFYRRLCMNSPYVNLLKSYIDEVLETLPTDGLFLDIVFAQDCSCKYCLAGMEKEGINPANPAARRIYGYNIFKEFASDMTAFIRQRNKECSIFYNSGHIGPYHRNLAGSFTHFELESLPSGGWGYLHFPLTMRLARNMGVDCMGMTGKFHTSWGDFHSYKNKAALQFECFNMLALNAKCSIGDQLHPNGKIDQATYSLVGAVYAEVEKKEPWCRGARQLAEIGVFTPEDFSADLQRTSIPPAAFGAVRMLQEGAHQFDVVHSQSDFSKYKVIVLPDLIPVNEELGIKFNNYLSAGGSLIASFESGLDGSKSEFALKALGIKKKNDGPVDLAGKLVRGQVFQRGDYAEYILPKGMIGKGLPETEHVMYIKGMEVEPLPGSEILAHKVESYFDRTFEHFCSHRQTPSSGIIGAPAVVRNGKVIYFSHPIFTQYQQNAPRWCRVMFLNALQLLLSEPLLRLEAPSTTIASVNEQSIENRWIVHLLNYIPERRGQDFDIIEDVIPIFNIKISVKSPRNVLKVALVPQNERLQFNQVSGRIEFVLPKLDGHQMIEVTFN